VDCCGELHSTLLPFVRNATGSVALYGTPFHVNRPTPIVTPETNFIHAGDKLTLTGSNYPPGKPISIFLGDVAPCKLDLAAGCGPKGDRGVTNLGAPSVFVLPVDDGTCGATTTCKFSTTIQTSYLAPLTGVSPVAHPANTIQHANDFLTIEIYHPSVNVSPSTGRNMTVDGSGFAPNETVLIATSGAGRSDSFSVVTDGAGNFSGTFATQPTSPTGTYVLAATGQTSGLSALTPFILKTQAAFFRVNTRADAPQASPGPSCPSTPRGQCTLRSAIQAANALGGGKHTI